MAHLRRAERFDRDDNWVQTLHYSELALVKLKQLNDRPIQAIDDSLKCKFGALNQMNQRREALECAKECYCLYPTNHMAAFDLIESSIHNEDYEDAELYARTTFETITLSRDSHIPDNQRQYFTAEGAHYLAKAMLRLARSGDIPPEANQAVAQEAIALARRALEIRTQMNGLENDDAAHDMRTLADVLDYFNNVDDDEVLRLYEQSMSIIARVEGSLSINVAAGEDNLGVAYHKRAERARDDNDLDRQLANLELALPHYREAARVYRANNHVAKADDAVQAALHVEDDLQECTIARATATNA